MATDNLLVLKNGGHQDFRIIRISSSTTGLSVNDLCPPFKENRPSVVGVCQGLLCLSYSVADANIDISEYLLWDPSTNQHRVIPSPNIEIPSCTEVDEDDHYLSGCSSLAFSYVRGFGFDPQSGDFKLIKFVNVNYSGEDNYDHSYFLQICMFSVNQNCWKEIKTSESCYGVHTDSATCLDGVCYFEGSDCVVALNLSTEEFFTFPYPDILLPIDSRIFLVEFDGALACVVSTLYGAPKCYRIWIMDVVDGVRVWVKKINMSGFVARIPLGPCKKGGSFLLQGLNGTLMEYDFVTREVKTFPEFFDYPFRMKYFSYVDRTTAAALNNNGEYNMKLEGRKNRKMEGKKSRKLEGKKRLGRKGK